MLNLKVVVGAASVILLLSILELIRRGKLKERYALLWIFTSLGIVCFSFLPKLIKFLSDITGMYYLSIISLISFLFLLSIALHFSVVISKLHECNKKLAQEHALLKLKVDNKSKD